MAKNMLTLTESEMVSLVKDVVNEIVSEYGDNAHTRNAMGMAAKRGLAHGDASTYDNAMSSLMRRRSSRKDLGDFQRGFEECGNMEEEVEDFNEQPTNALVGENKNQFKMNESEFFNMIKESVKSILSEIGDKHRFGLGKYGLAMDAASKAAALGRYDQSRNLTKHGAEAFNKEYGTNGFAMNDFGNLDVANDYNKKITYTPKSRLNDIERASRKHDGNAHIEAAKNNVYIKNKAQTAKAFPRKKMTGGISAIDSLDAQLHGQN